jgi:Protein of unknown function (DUF3035)
LRSKSVALVMAAAALGTSLGGCTDFRRAIGWEKSIPDEFAVVSRAPLAIPPDYSLRPPQPGAPPSQEMTPQDQAREVVFRAGQQQATLPPAAGQRSPGEGALLRDAGANVADPTIRANVSRDVQSGPENERSFTEKLLFWRKSSAASNQVLDPAKEAERIRQAQAAGTPIAPDAPGAAPGAQGPAPTIERKKSTSVFNLF